MTVTTPPIVAKSVAFRAVALFVAVASVGVGIALMVTADLGVAPADVLSTGGAERLGIGVGTMGWISGAVITSVAWIMGRRPQWGTLWGTFVVGLSVNLNLAWLSETESMVWRIVMFVIGLSIIYLGITVGVSTMLGTGPIELLMLALTDRGASVQVSRWGIEAVILTAGAILGGQVGVGTVVFVVLAGPVLARTLPPVVRFMGTTVLDRPLPIER
ncbi:MAG: hypothetical protein O3B66_06620 [Actinomycetota bacterium]|nr:hypothetical protein [Actinomycetota bacterium]MDA3011279.1 hypothetical protein [Actinomycetota bacterium]MDA3024271.1 hypothetical protein [Actinomycetota bacterium]